MLTVFWALLFTCCNIKFFKVSKIARSVFLVTICGYISIFDILAVLELCGIFAEIILSFLGFMKYVLLLFASYSILIKYGTPASFMGVPNKSFSMAPSFSFKGLSMP